MWRLSTPASRDDSGVGTLFVILAMTAIIVGAAFAIDVGRYVVEARSAQNSADATVLAVATDCATRSAPIADYSPYRKDGHTISTPSCGSGQTSITVTADVNDGLLLNRNEGTVTRSATARWGTLSQANTIPITISNCEFSTAILEGTTDITLYLDDTRPQTGCSSLPGGFSELAHSNCSVAITAGGTVAGSPGADLQDVVPCITNPTPPPLPHDVLVPLYDAAACQASRCNGQGPYTILGFAAFRVTGYSFNGNNFAGTLGRNCPDTTRGRLCIRGDFIRMTTSQGTTGTSTNYGLTQVYLYS